MKKLIKFLKKNKKSLLIFISISLLYFLVRTPKLNSLPIFNDEVFYMHWASLMLDDPSKSMLAIERGRQPLFIWVSSLVMWVVNDPVLPGRIVSLFSGFGTLIGISFLSFQLFKNKKITIFTGIIYIFYPFAQVYDRTGVLDSLLTSLIVWAYVFSISLARHQRLDTAYTLGFIIGAGLLTKANALFNLYLLPVTLLLFDFKSKSRVQRILKWGIYCLITAIVAEIVHGISLFHPSYPKILAINGTIIYPLRELIVKSPLEIINIFIGNFSVFSHWFIKYLTLPYLVLLLLSFFINRQYVKEKLMLFLFFLMPLVIFFFFARVQFPRYIYPMTISLIPLIALSMVHMQDFAIYYLKKSKININNSWIVVLLIIFYPALTILNISYNFKNADIPQIEKDQYYPKAALWLYDSVSYLNNSAVTHPIEIYIDRSQGWMTEAFALFLFKNPNITIRTSKDNINVLRNKIDNNEAYYITSSNSGEINNNYLTPKVLKEVSKNQFHITAKIKS